MAPLLGDGRQWVFSVLQGTAAAPASPEPLLENASSRAQFHTCVKLGGGAQEVCIFR